MLVKPTTRQSYFCLYVNNAFLIILKNLTITQMLHGCRSDLILKRLVHSKKVSLLVV